MFSDFFDNYEGFFWEYKLPWVKYDPEPWNVIIFIMPFLEIIKP